MAKRKRINNILIIALVALIIILVAAVAIRNRNKPKGEKVTVEKVEKRTIMEKVAASGKVFPVTEVKISSDVSGEIVDLYVEEGDSVVMGQVLAKIDPDAYLSQVERGQATVNNAKAQYSNALSNIESTKAQKEQIEAQLIAARDVHKRNEQLKKDGVISDADFESSLSNLRALEANIKATVAQIRSAQESANAAQFSVKSAEASLKELRTSLNRTTIYAPMNGIVSKLDVEKGERVVGTIQMQGTEMMRIADLNDMEVRVDVSESDIPRVAFEDEVDIEVDAYINRVFKGKVTQIANSATGTGTTTSLTSDQVTNFEVRISINPESYKDLIAAGKRYPFRPGMSASVEIKTEVREGVVSVPIQSVTTRDRNEDEKEEMTKDQESTDIDFMEVVFIASGDSVIQREVVTGIQDDSYIQVTEGVEEGDEVVKAPYSAISRKLKNGSQIQKVEEDKLFDGN